MFYKYADEAAARYYEEQEKRKKEREEQRRSPAEGGEKRGYGGKHRGEGREEPGFKKHKSGGGRAQYDEEESKQYFETLKHTHSEGAEGARPKFTNSRKVFVKPEGAGEEARTVTDTAKQQPPQRVVTE